MRLDSIPFVVVCRTLMSEQCQRAVIMNQHVICWRRITAWGILQKIPQNVQGTYFTRRPIIGPELTPC